MTSLNLAITEKIKESIENNLGLFSVVEVGFDGVHKIISQEKEFEEAFKTARACSIQNIRYEKGYYVYDPNGMFVDISEKIARIILN